MEEAIRNFAKQFGYEPTIENSDKLQKVEKFIVAGMGGSHLQGELLQAVCPALDLVVHRDYGLPKLPENVLKSSLAIASSYSGNTEEAISAFEEAIGKDYPVAAVSTGGKLVDLAKRHGVPYILMPDTGIQPRSATGLALLALAKLTGQEDVLREAAALASQLAPDTYEEQGKALAATLKGRVPVIYSSQRNETIAYNWKIKFNETGKIPAVYNVFPELNHNEMTGFDVSDATRDLAESFHFVFLKDSEDNPRVQKRMEVLEKQLKDRRLPVEVVQLEGDSRLFRIFSSILVADWTALYTARQYGSDPEQVPMIEEFKKLIS